MSEPKHLAVEANENSIRYVMERNKAAWLALYSRVNFCQLFGRSLGFINLRCPSGPCK